MAIAQQPQTDPKKKLTLKEFGAKYKETHPSYADRDDEALGQAVLDKFPVYSDRVDIKPLEEVNTAVIEGVAGAALAAQQTLQYNIPASIAGSAAAEVRSLSGSMDYLKLLKDKGDARVESLDVDAAFQLKENINVLEEKLTEEENDRDRIRGASDQAYSIANQDEYLSTLGRKQDELNKTEGELESARAEWGEYMKPILDDTSKAAKTLLTFSTKHQERGQEEIGKFLKMTTDDIKDISDWGDWALANIGSSLPYSAMSLTGGMGMIRVEQGSIENDTITRMMEESGKPLQQILDEGVDQRGADLAIKNGIAAGLLEQTGEILTIAIPWAGLGLKAGTQIPKSAFKGLLNTGMKVGGKMLAAATIEGATEVGQTIIELRSTLKALGYTDKEAKEMITWKELKDPFLAGFVASSGMSAPSSAVRIFVDNAKAEHEKKEKAALTPKEIEVMSPESKAGVAELEIQKEEAISSLEGTTPEAENIQETTPMEDTVTETATVQETETVEKSEQEEEIVAEEAVNEEEYLSEQKYFQETSPFNWAVDPVTEEDLKTSTIAKHEGTYGVVTDDGDIKGLFNPNVAKLREGKVAEKGTLKGLIPKLIAAGGVKLDNFDGRLTKMYEDNGFVVTSRVKFDEELAPKGWNEKEHGKPDIVAMIYDPKKELKIEEKTFDNYDDVIAYRDSFLETKPVEASKGSKAKDELATGLEMLARVTGITKNAVAVEGDSMEQAIKHIGNALIAAGEATIENVSEKVKEYLEKNKIKGITSKNVDAILLNEKASKQSSVELFDNPSAIDPVRMPNGRTKVVEFGRAVDQRAKDEGYYIPLSETNSPEAKEQIATGIADDAELQLKNDNSGIGWYDTKTKSAMELMARLHPELAEEKEAHLRFTLMVAIISQNNTVRINFNDANRAYTYYKETGKLPTQKYSGKSGNIIRENIANVFKKIDQDGWESVKTLLKEEKTVGEWKESGYENADELVSTTVTGAMTILGSKIGSFWGNLNGDFSTLTADLWFSRMFNRYTGNTEYKGDLDAGKKDVLERLAAYKNGRKYLYGFNKSAIKNDPKIFDQWLDKIELAYRKGGFQDKHTLAVGANTLHKNRKGRLQDIPRNGTERQTMREVVEMAQKKLMERGFPKIDIADIQAIIWYNEKDLYQQYKAVNKSSEKVDYETAAQEELAKAGIGNDVALQFQRGERGADGTGDTASKAKPKESSKTKASLKDKAKDQLAEGAAMLARLSGVTKMAAPVEGDSFANAIKLVGDGLINAGLATAENVVEKVKEYLKKNGFKNIKDTDVEAVFAVKPKKKATPKKKVEKAKKKVASRAYEGTFKDKVKRLISAAGLDREVENQEKAWEAAGNLVKEIGIDAALSAVRNRDINGSAITFVYSRIIEAVQTKMETASTEEENSNLAQQVTDLVLELSDASTEAGQQISALNFVYNQLAHLGFNADRAIAEVKARNNGEISKEQEKGLRESAKKIGELQEKIKKLEQEAKDEAANKAIQGIIDSVERDNVPTVKHKKAKKAINAIKRLRSKIKANAYSDVVGIVAIVDTGLTVIQKSIEAGIQTADAIEAGIRFIKGKLKEKGVDVWEKENQFRIDATEAFLEEGLSNPSKKPTIKDDGTIFIPQALIREYVEKGFHTIEDLTEALREEIAQEIPDVTNREIRDAITGYGKQSSLNKEEIATRIRQMKRIGRILSALEDIKNKKRPVRSGRQRDKLDAKERALNKELREAMKELPQDMKLEAENLKNATEGLKSRLRNRIEDLELEIANKERTPQSKRVIKDDKEIDELRAKLKEVKERHKEVFDTAEEQAKKRLELLKRNTERRIKDLKERILNFDFGKKEKPKQVQDTELTRLRGEKLKLQEVFDKQAYMDKLRDRTKVDKARDFIWDAWGLTRVLMATGEFSFVLIQGLSQTIAHPKNALKGLKNAWRFMWSEKKIDKFLENLRGQEWYSEASQSKLAITTPHAELSAREELFYSDWANMIWDKIIIPLKLFGGETYEKGREFSPLKMIERAAVGFLDTVRVERWLDGKALLEEKGMTFESDPKAFKQMTDLINTLTGRASLGALEQNSDLLTKIFFSPRNWASAMKVTFLAPMYFASLGDGKGLTHKPSVAQKMMMTDFLRVVGLTTSIVMLAAASLNNDDDDETGVSLDPTDTDFMKIKIGDIRIDPWGGKIQQIIFMSRMIFGSIHKNGEDIPLGTNFKSPTRLDLITQQATNKLAPSASLLYKSLSTTVDKDGQRKDAYGNDYAFNEELMKSLYPIFIQTWEELAEDGIDTLDGLLLFYAFFGGGVNKYGKLSENKVQKEMDRRAKKDKPKPPALPKPPPTRDDIQAKIQLEQDMKRYAKEYGIEYIPPKR